MALQEGCRNPRRDEILKAQNEVMGWIWDDGEPTWAGYDQESSPGFVKWLQSEDRIFWIYGKPGAGKSTLMKQLTQSKQTFDLRPRGPKPVVTVSYFFYELGQHQERQFKSLLMAILSTLLQTLHNTDPRAVSSIMNILESQESRNQRDQKQPIWKDEQLQEALCQTLIVCQHSASLLLFVDGMDECEGDHRGQLDFLRTWIESSAKSKLSIKACIASRDETEIKLRLSRYPSLPVHNFTKANISAYVTRRLGNAWEMMSRQPDHTTAKFDQGLIDALVKKAEGVFLWVDLVVTQLTLGIEEERTVEVLWMQLNEMPDGLRALYSRIVDKIPPRLLHDTANFLRLYDHDTNPDRTCRTQILEPHLFTLWEFCAATEDPSTAISCKAHFEDGFAEESTHRRQDLCATMKRRIQRSCRGLIFVEDTNNLPKAGVTLLHRTVKQFLIRDDNFRQLLKTADQQLIKDPEFLLMGMSLRLLKVDLAYEPKWINWVSPENCETNSDIERMEVDEEDEEDEDEVWEEEDEEDEDDYEKSFRSDESFRSEIVYFFLFAAAAAARNTGFSYRPYIDELDRVLSSLRPDWAGLYYRSYEENTRTDWNTDLHCLAVAHELGVYLEEEFKRERARIVDSNRRPLLCYLFDLSIMWVPSPEFLQTLIKYGADPNEQFQEITPWTWAVKRDFEICEKYGAPDITCVEMFAILLEHGANPICRVYRRSMRDNTVFPQTLVCTTTFHIILSAFLDRDPGGQVDMIELLLLYCEDFDAADSDGITISACADLQDGRPLRCGYTREERLGEMVRDEITAMRQRQRIHER